MRHAPIILAAFPLALISTPAPAADSDIGYKSPTKVEGICGEKDGTYWATPDGSSWGCGYKGGGGIMCDKGGKDDKGNDIPAGCLETARGGKSPDFPLGLAGLVGLIGLAGFAGASRRPRTDAPRPVDR